MKTCIVLELLREGDKIETRRPRMFSAFSSADDYVTQRTRHFPFSAIDTVTDAESGGPAKKTMIALSADEPEKYFIQFEIFEVEANEL